MWIFEPILKTHLWGGEKIISYKGLSSIQSSVGECWELSGVEGSESVVAQGVDKGLTLPQLLDKYKSGILGNKNYNKYGNRFPILVKFIDAAENLSVQVHPDDETAQRKGERMGKTEMWYVLESEEGAQVASGFRSAVDPEHYHGLVESGDIVDTLNYINISRGDAFFIPAGRVHTICKGAFIVEIQQNSDVTYRLYDYKRKDKNGKERTLHVEEALEAINFNDMDGKSVDYSRNVDVPVNLVNSPFFNVNLWHIKNEVTRDYSEWDTFVIIVCTEGSAELCSGGESMLIKKGMTVLIPASAKGLTVIPNEEFEALETYIK